MSIGSRAETRAKVHTVASRVQVRSEVSNRKIQHLNNRRCGHEEAGHSQAPATIVPGALTSPAPRRFARTSMLLLASKRLGWRPRRAMVPRGGVARLGVIALLPAGLVFGCGHSAPEAQSSQQHSAAPASASKRQDPTWENIRRIIAQRINVPEEKVIPTARFTEDFNAAEPDMEDMIEGFEDAFGIESEPDDQDMLITVQDAVDYINAPVTFRQQHAGQDRYSEVRDPYPTDVKYSKAHAWVRVEGNKASIGVTYAFQQRYKPLGRVHFPPVGEKLAAGEMYGTVDAGMAGAVLNTPVSGVITEVNRELAGSGKGINRNPYTAWIIRVDLTNPKELDTLLSAAEYANFVDAGN